jgi:hypothetical protein
VDTPLLAAEEALGEGSDEADLYQETNDSFGWPRHRSGSSQVQLLL